MVSKARAARLLVIQHEDDCPPAWFGEWFIDAGLELDVRLGHQSDEIPESLAEHDGLVVLGGEMGAYDDTEHEWLTATKALIARTVRSDRPFLGICLGHQLAAVALGGEVIVNPHGQALGLTPVTLTADGRRDDLLRAVGSGAASIQWNSDVVSQLPPDSVVLAEAPDGTIQAARFAPRAWGVQFHPEASPAVFDSWITPAVTGEQRDRLEAALETIEASEEWLRRNWEPLASRFASIVVSEPVVL